MSTTVIAAVGIGIVATAIAVVLRGTRPEFALLVSLAAGVFILFKIFGDLVPIVAQIEAVLSSSQVPAQYAGILFKSLGICMLAQVACDACKDAGESAIASKIEIAGRIAVLAVSLPLFTQVLSIVYSLIE